MTLAREGPNVSEQPDAAVDSTGWRMEQAALELFYTQGFSGTAVRQITESCGMTPGSLYNHHRSKEGLLQTIVIRTQQHLNERLDFTRDATADADARTQLHALMSVFAAFHTEYPRESLVANSEWRWIKEPMQAQVLRTHRAVRQRFEDVINAGCDSGEFHLPPPGDEEALKVTVIAIMNMGIRIAAWFEPGGRMSADTVAEVHAGLAVAMVTGDNGS